MARRNAGFRGIGSENVKFAMRAMVAQKLRSFLTLLGIVAGVATVIAMVSFVSGFNDAVTDSFSSFGTTLVQFQKYEQRFGGGGPLPEDQKRRRNLTIEDAEALKRTATLAAAVSQERYLFGPAGASLIIKTPEGTEANGPTFVGTNPDYAPSNNSFVQDGRFLADADIAHASRTCVLGPETATALFGRKDPIGRIVLVNGTAFSVVGLLEKKGSFLGGDADNILIVPISTFDEMFPQVKNGTGDTIHIATVPKDPKRMYEMMDQEVAILRARRGLRANQPNDFAIFTSEAQLKTFQQITGGIAGAMILIAAIALLVGGVGVMNIMLVSVTERTREIGVRKALGATRKDIAMQFLVEAISLTGVGGAIGIAVGLGIAMLVRLVFEFPAAAPIWSIILGFGVSTAVGLIFGLWPALKAAKQDPIEALRYE
ncbi:ABC transporter permease [Geothrix edaphica]|uniref:ABC transporter permease n=1 Tax=Geothrix edaphica TaxID=2927976 RepID=A0ABQ5PUX1_9BACT|nr:ABC transporter permease [Geothrix edaphica]GLH66153.1 ABC transporter permease [Geothrix edaphica]